MAFRFLSGIPVLKMLAPGEDRDRAANLYDKIVEQARQPHFYAEWNVPDTVEGRYDMLTLHMILIVRRLSQDAEKTRRFTQILMDTMFRNMDHSMRELGVGDLKVGKKVRELAEMFYGRAGSYEEPIFEQDRPALAAAIGKNVHGPADQTGADALANYTLAVVDQLAGQPVDALMLGEVLFPDPAHAVT